MPEKELLPEERVVADLLKADIRDKEAKGEQSVTRKMALEFVIKIRNSIKLEAAKIDKSDIPSSERIETFEEWLPGIKSLVSAVQASTNGALEEAVNVLNTDLDLKVLLKDAQYLDNGTLVDMQRVASDEVWSENFELSRS